jgi:hypothetical protein
MFPFPTNKSSNHGLHINPNKHQYFRQSNFCLFDSPAHFRKSCICPPFRFSICATSKPPDVKGLPSILVADKPKRCKRPQNVFVNDRGFLDETEHYEALLRNVDDGVILRKLKHPPPSLNRVNPLFSCPYNEAKHGEQIRHDFTYPILNPKYATVSITSSRSTGLCLTQMEFLFL